MSDLADRLERDRVFIHPQTYDPEMTTVADLRRIAEALTEAAQRIRELEAALRLAYDIILDHEGDSMDREVRQRFEAALGEGE